MIAQKPAEQTYNVSELAAQSEGRPWLRRAVAGALLSVAVSAALTAGGWGLFAAQVSHSATVAGHAVSQGEVAETPGGLLRVDDVLLERMEHAQTGKFSKSGMNMGGMGVDMAPEGQRRFTVEVSLSAGSGGLEYSAEDFRLTGGGMKEATPVRSQLGDGVLPEGSDTHGVLIFQAPEDASGLMLSFDGGEPVALDLGNGGSAGDGDASGEGEGSNGAGSAHGH